MSIRSRAVPSTAGSFVRVALLVLAAFMAGCATPYLDGAVKEVPPGAYAKPSQTAPAQVLVEFQTNGVANARATELIKPMVLEHLRASGLFSDLNEKPVAGGAIVSVTLNNVALVDEAVKKGFLTGLTLGAAGSTVTDGYVCTVRYLPAGQASPVEATAKHAIHTAMGSADGPPNGVKMNSFDEAVRTMVRQVTGLALHDLSRAAAFR